MPSLRNRVGIFDVHQQQIVINPVKDEERQENPNLLRDFVCQTPPSASHTCSQLQQDAKTKQELKLRKKGRVHSRSPLETGELSDLQCSQLARAASLRLPVPEIAGADHKNCRKENGRLKRKFLGWARQRKDDNSDDGHQSHGVHEWGVVSGTHDRLLECFEAP
jgi:hypothetical protein